MNFAETIAYWYLRFNGFFLLQNFVFHKEPQGSADIDLLAVRFPYVEEEIGGQEDDWDNEKFYQCGLNFNEKIIGLIVEVKSGYFRTNNLFPKDRVKYAVKRLGFLKPEQVEAAVQELGQKSIFSSERHLIGKLLISSERPQELASFCFISLADAEEFLKRRIEKYSSPKHRDRMYFGDDLIQYLAWKSHRVRN